MGLSVFGWIAYVLVFFKYMGMFDASKWYEIRFVGCFFELAFQRAQVCPIWMSIEGVMAHFMIGYIR